MGNCGVYGKKSDEQKKRKRRKHTLHLIYISFHSFPLPRKTQINRQFFSSSEFKKYIY